MTDAEAAGILGQLMHEKPEMIPILEKAYARGVSPLKIAELYIDACQRVIFDSAFAADVYLLTADASPTLGSLLGATHT